MALLKPGNAMFFHYYITGTILSALLLLLYLIFKITP